MATKPFPRLAGLKEFTWDDCFALGQQGIRAGFINSIVENATNEGDKMLRKMANRLLVMTDKERTPTAAPESMAPVQGFTFVVDKKNPNAFSEIIQSIPLPVAVPKTSPKELQRVFWSPRGTSLKLHCYSIYDLLGACMSDAAWLPSSDPIQKTRTKANYYAPLASLYSYWCLRIRTEVTNRPTMSGLAYLGDIILLGCSIPGIPGIPTGKETIRLARLEELAGRGRQEGSNKQILDLNKVKSVAQDYGNCAETWTFCLLCMQDSSTLKDVQGIAVRIPSKDVLVYDEKKERTNDKYEPLCLNCSRLITQIGLWNSGTAEVVKNFNPTQWSLT